MVFENGGHIQEELGYGDDRCSAFDASLHNLNPDERAKRIRDFQKQQPETAEKETKL